MSRRGSGQVSSCRAVISLRPPVLASLPHSDSHQQAVCTGPYLQVWPRRPLPGTAPAPLRCLSSIGFRQAISAQLHTGSGLRKWLTRALRTGLYDPCIPAMVFCEVLLLFNALAVSCGMLLKHDLHVAEIKRWRRRALRGVYDVRAWFPSQKRSRVDVGGDQETNNPSTLHISEDCVICLSVVCCVYWVCLCGLSSLWRISFLKENVYSC